MGYLIALHFLKYRVAGYAALFGDLGETYVLSFKWIFAHFRRLPIALWQLEALAGC